MQVRLDAHQGIDHEKAVVLYGIGHCRFSARRTGPRRRATPSASTTISRRRPWILTWIVNQFERKWNNQTGNSKPSPSCRCRRTRRSTTGRPTAPPTSRRPAANAVAGTPASGRTTTTSTSARTPNPPLLESQQEARTRASRPRTIGSTRFPTLQPGTRYYWKIVSKTMAFVTAEGRSGASRPPAPRRQRAADREL